MTNLDSIVALAKRRGFIYPGSEIYGGLANAWDYGPVGVELKNNIKNLWWKKFVHGRDDIVGLDAAIMMNRKVWEASGHVNNFTDPLVECLNCHYRDRVDQILPTDKLVNFRSIVLSDIEKQQKKLNDSLAGITSIPKVIERIESATYLNEAQKREFIKSLKGVKDAELNSSVISNTRLSKIIEDVGKSFKYEGELTQFILNTYTPCPNCERKNIWTQPKSFNLMFKTNMGPIDDSSSLVYLRPETAQAMFIDFKSVLDTTRMTIPFGIAQIGKAFRNEITTGNYIFRTREFEQMEIEYFIPEPTNKNDWLDYFIEWKNEFYEWFKLIGLDVNKIKEYDVPEYELAHYSKKTIDFEYEFPFGLKELYGLAYRTNFDLKNHERMSGNIMKYRDNLTAEEYYPHVIEPTWGVDRTVLAVLCDAYREEGENEKKRIYLKIKPILAPYKIAVFPLVRNREDIVDKARSVYKKLKQKYNVIWDDRGNIGKRYYSQDEIGTPWCVTVDHQTLEDDTVTIRDRDTTEQDRVNISKLTEYIDERLRSL